MSVGVAIGKWLGQNVEGLTYSEVSESTIFINEAPTVPDESITIVDTGGGEADSALPYDEPHVQLIFRSTSDPQWALDMWRAVYDRLHGLRNVQLPDGPLLIYCLVRQSNPVSIGTDDNDRHMYTMNLRMETLNPTTERPA